MVGYDKIIAQTALEIDAIRLWPKDGPFLWASGFHMPIYNDNRRFLCDSDYRKMIAKSMRELMSENSIGADLIAGTSTAGIAPAASLAQLLRKPLVIQHDKNVYMFDETLLEELCYTSDPGVIDATIVSTCPFAIPPAVYSANEKGRPFAYVRMKKKDHGLGRQIEGVVKSGQRAFLADYHLGDSYCDHAKDALEREGVDVQAYVTSNISDLLKPVDVSGKRIIQVEDLVSTGGSCVKEIDRYRMRGAQVLHCLSIFSYGLEKALDQFDAAEVTLLPCLTYPVLLEEAVASGHIPQDSVEMLADWRADPFGWGEKNGYPPVKK